MAAQRYDLVIIGSGPGGYRAAVLAALRGLKVAIIERHTWGGTCLNRGCVPKKAWHHSAQLVAASHGFPRRGIQGRLAAELTHAWTHQRQVVGRVRDSYTGYLDRLGVARLTGHARFLAPDRLAVDGGEAITFAHAIVATGSQPHFPPALPATARRILSSDELFDAPPPPGRRVAVCGSGVVATEFAFILAMLGCHVTWVAQHEPLAGQRYGAQAKRALHSALQALRLSCRAGARALAAEVGEHGVRLHLADASRVDADWVLAAGGRIPNSADLGLAEAGIATDADGFIVVDAAQRSANPAVFAIGDVCTREMSANQALAQATVAVANIVAPGSAAHDALAVPQLVYSALKLGRIGLNEDEAEADGRETAVGLAAFDANPRALGQDMPEGFVRLVADADSGALLGAEIVGAEAGELINLIGQQYGRTDALQRLAGTRFNHPSRAEEIGNACETLAAQWGMGRAVFGAPE